MYSSLLVCLVAALATPTAVHASTTFIKPPTDGPAGDYDTNPRYTDGKPIEIIFRTTLDNMNIIAVQDWPLQDNVHGGMQQTIAQDTQMTTLSWTPNATEWTTNGNDDIVLYIGVYTVDDNSRDGASHYFNVTVPKSDSSSASSSATSSPTTAVTISSSSSSSSATSTDAGSKPSGSSSSAQQGNDSKKDDSSSSSGLSTGAKAGIAVGVTVGALAVLGGLALMLWKRRKARANAEPSVQELPPADNGEGYYAPSGYAKSSPYAPSPASVQSHMNQPQMQQQYQQPNVIHEAP